MTSHQINNSRGTQLTAGARAYWIVQNMSMNMVITRIVKHPDVTLILVKDLGNIRLNSFPRNISKKSDLLARCLHNIRTGWTLKTS